ncbi:MAG: cyclic nucleotide-binding domain-containing protein [Actinomycetota bacterium]|nr:cyclic nucleotide-binding domain-containing protein [Actinomycetota bacterium]
MTDFDLASVPLFSKLPEKDLARLSEGVTDVSLERGEALFAEGDEADMAYVITEGELEILKESAGRSVRIAVSQPGDVVGEMAMLTGEARNAGARAITAVRLIAIPRACLDDVLSTSVDANRALFAVFITRWREQESRVRQSERMAQIGVLTAGLAHEMNNPAAAVTSGSQGLSQGLENLTDLALRLPHDVVLPSPSHAGQPLSSMRRADVEEAVAQTLQTMGVSDAWRLASDLAGSGFTAGDLSGVDGDHAVDVISFVAATASLRSLLAEVTEGSRRLSELVAALKSYSFLDQAPVQQVNLAQGIEDTLLILRSKTRGIAITTEYADDLPAIVAYGSQLNQVWTNLIDNAVDALHDAGLADGQITIRAFPQGENVVIEIENEGPPIPEEVIDRIFEAFYTTKEPGRGTGLGLDTAYRIVVTQHRGSLTVSSGQDATVFRVTLPTTQAALPD